MARLHKRLRNDSVMGKVLRGAVGDKTFDTFHPIGTAIVKATTAPEAPPPVAPLPDEEDIKRARRRSTTAQLQRSGRASTILSDSDRLGP